MPAKPILSFVMPRSTYDQMFRPDDLRRLSEVAELRGPLNEVTQGPELADLLKGATVAMTGWGSPRFSDELLSHAGALKLIAHTAGSVKGVVTEGVYDRGIRVTTSAGANAVPVAQFTVALMVMLLKQVPWLAEDYRHSETRSLPRVKQVRELQDMEVGLVGASRIGRLVVGMLKQYPRLTIKMYDPYLDAEEATELGVVPSSLEDVFRCELVSIHAPKTPETHHMVNARLLGLLPDHAVLINTSRGALIDEDALVAEVRKRPLYVALDVTEPEPPAMDSPLRKERNILLTPHIAGAMRQARRDMGALAVEEVLRFFHNQPLQTEVTRAMLPTQA